MDMTGSRSHKRMGKISLNPNLMGNRQKEMGQILECHLIHPKLL